MLAETLTQNALAIPSNEMTLQIYTTKYIDNRITSKFNKNSDYYRNTDHKKFSDFIDSLLIIASSIPQIKDFVMKDYNSYEFTKLEVINLNGNKNKLLRKYISGVNKDIC